MKKALIIILITIILSETVTGLVHLIELSDGNQTFSMDFYWVMPIFTLTLVGVAFAVSKILDNI